MRLQCQRLYAKKKVDGLEPGQVNVLMCTHSSLLHSVYIYIYTCTLTWHTPLICTLRLCQTYNFVDGFFHAAEGLGRYSIYHPLLAGTGGGHRKGWGLGKAACTVRAWGKGTACRRGPGREGRSGGEIHIYICIYTYMFVYNVYMYIWSRWIRVYIAVQMYT